MTVGIEARIGALATELEVSEEDITQAIYSDNCFVVNKRKIKRGEAPEYYEKIIAKFKSLLTPRKEVDIKKFITEPNGKSRDKLYRTVSRYLKRYKQEKPEYKEIKEKTLYVENVLYHLLSGEDRDFVRNYQKAFLNEPVEDNREWAEVDDGEYLVLTDGEADEATREYIEGSVWAFNSWFVAGHTDVSRKTIEHIQQLCEGANEPLLELIDDFGDFVEDAIDADGRGHFLSHYDGEEMEIETDGETLYIYRTN